MIMVDTGCSRFLLHRIRYTTAERFLLRSTLNKHVQFWQRNVSKNHGYGDKRKNKKLKGSEQRLVEYMDGAKKRFVIPVYQRNYDWKMENSEQLFDNLVKIIRSGRKSHFFGSIVSVYNPDGRNSEYIFVI